MDEMVTLKRSIELLTDAQLRFKRMSDKIQTDWNDPAGRNFEKITQSFKFPLKATISELQNLLNLISNSHRELE